MVDKFCGGKGGKPGPCPEGGPAKPGILGRIRSLFGRSQAQPSRPPASTSNVPQTVKSGKNLWTSTFATGHGPYVVEAELDNDNDHWSINFALLTEGGGQEFKTTGTAGTGAVAVLRAVGAAVDNFVSEKKPKSFEFSADTNEGSRVRLYDKVSKLIAARHGYGLKRTEIDYLHKVEYTFVRGQAPAGEHAASFAEMFDDDHPFRLVRGCACGHCGREDCVPSPAGWDAFAASIGFTGEKTDALGRRICYDNGKRVACAKQTTPAKPAGKAAPAKTTPGKAVAKPAAASKPTVEGMATALKSIKAAGPVSAAKTKEVAGKLAQLTVPQLKELHAALGQKAPKGLKADLVNSVVKHATEKVTAKATTPSPGEGGPKPTAPTAPVATSGQSVKDFAYPAGYKSPQHLSRPNPVVPDVTRPVLSKQEAAAVTKYTETDTFRSLNKSLRKGGKPLAKLAGLHATLQAAFGKAAPFDKPVTVYRGMNLEDPDTFAAMVKSAATSGKPVRFPGYSSCSTDPVDRMGSSFRGNVSIEIEATHGLDVKPYSDMPSENELLLNHDSEFDVAGTEKKPDGGLIVRLRQRSPMRKASEAAATFAEALEMFADAKPDGETGDRASRFVDTDWDWIDFDPETTDAIADATDPADPDAAEKARLMAELLLGGEDREEKPTS